MRNSYRCNCQNCGYEIYADYSAGDLTPALYEKTIRRMKKGQFGKPAKEFFQEHPDGAISVQPGLYICSGCGALASLTTMDMYLPKPGYVHGKANNVLLVNPQIDPTVYPEELEEHYTEALKFKHICTSCKQEMFPIYEKNLLKLLVDENLRCPQCGDPIVLQEMFF